MYLHCLRSTYTTFISKVKKKWTCAQMNPVIPLSLGWQKGLGYAPRDTVCHSIYIIMVLLAASSETTGFKSFNRADRCHCNLYLHVDLMRNQFLIWNMFLCQSTQHVGYIQRVTSSSSNVNSISKHLVGPKCGTAMAMALYLT